LDYLDVNKNTFPKYLNNGKIVQKKTVFVPSKIVTYPLEFAVYATEVKLKISSVLNFIKF
jgi:hypothetical protein